MQTASKYSFPNLESVHCSMPHSICCFLTCIQVCQEAGKMVWYSHLLENFPQLWSTESMALVLSMKQKQMFFWNSLVLSKAQQMLAIWPLVPLPFQNPKFQDIWKFSVQAPLKPHFSSVVQSCLTCCNAMDCSTPGLPVHHQLPELAKIHVHWIHYRFWALPC